MKIKHIVNQSQQFTLNTPLDLELGTTILKQNLGVTEEDTVLIVTDLNLLEKEAAIWFESAKRLNPSNFSLVVLEGLTSSGQETPSELVTKCQAASVVILHTSFSLTHTQASQAGAKNNGRVASLPTVNYSMMKKTLRIDYQHLQQTGQKLQQIIAQGKKMSITSENGTSLTTTIRSNGVYNDCGIISPGEIGNLPAGEVFFAPIEGTTNGTWIIDGSLADIEVDSPITLHIIDGMVSSISGKNAATKLQQVLEKVGPEAFNVAEIGIGTNTKASPVSPIIEAEKAYKTAHLAVGNNAFIGGSVAVPIHLDGLTMNPNISVDNTQIVQKGNFVF